MRLLIMNLELSCLCTTFVYVREHAATGIAVLSTGGGGAELCPGPLPLADATDAMPDALLVCVPTDGQTPARKCRADLSIYR